MIIENINFNKEKNIFFFPCSLVFFNNNYYK